MSKIPPQHFCSTVLRLIALYVISLGEGYLHAMFATQTRIENVLLNLLIPLFLRVGTGRKGNISVKLSKMPETGKDIIMFQMYQS